MTAEPVDFRARVAQHYLAKGYTVHQGVRAEGNSGNAYHVAMLVEAPLGRLLVSFGDAGGVDAEELGRVKGIAKDIGATPVLAHPSFPAEMRRRGTQMGVVLLDGSLSPGTPGGPPAPSGSSPASDSPSWPGFEVPGQRRAADLEAHPWPVSGRARPELPGGMAASDVDQLVGEWRRSAQPPGAPAVPAPPTAPGAPWRHGRDGRPVEAAAPAIPAAVPVAPAPPAAQGKFQWLPRAVPEPAAPASPVQPTVARAASSATVLMPPAQALAHAPAETSATGMPAEAAVDGEALLAGEHSSVILARPRWLPRSLLLRLSAAAGGALLLGWLLLRSG